MTTKTMPPEYQSAFALSKAAPFVYVSSLDEKGFPETRVMFNLRNTCADAFERGVAALKGDFQTYLGTNASSRKASQLRADGRVCLYYSNNESFQGLSVRGRVAEVADREKKASIWKPDWDMYYPGGLDGGDFLLLCFEPEVARYYHGLKVVEFGL